jgi:hypothetical protein
MREPKRTGCSVRHLEHKSRWNTRRYLAALQRKLSA